MDNLIEKTRQSLISQYGESKTEVVNGMNFKSINSYLDYFDVFVKRFQKVLNALDFDCSNYQNELGKMFEYFETADQIAIKEISSSMRNLMAKIKVSDKEEYKLRMQQFFESIRQLMKNPNFNIEQIKVCFATDLGLNVTTGSTMRKSRTYAIFFSR